MIIILRVGTLCGPFRGGRAVRSEIFDVGPLTSVRPSVRTKRLGFGALDGVRAPSPRPLYSVGDCSMIQLNDSESLVSVQQVFSDHRARAPTGQTRICYSSPAWGQTHIVDLRGRPGGDLGRKSSFAKSFRFDPASLTDSPAMPHATSRPLLHPGLCCNHTLWKKRLKSPPALRGRF